MGRCSGRVRIRSQGAVSRVVVLSVWNTAELLSWFCRGAMEGVEEGPLACFTPVTVGQVLPQCHPTWYRSFPGGRGVRPAFLSSCRVEQIGLNATNSFLVYTEEDLGDLLKIKLTWKGTPQSWYSLWRELRSYLSQPRKSERELNIRRIRVKSGETQQK